MGKSTGKIQRIVKKHNVPKSFINKIGTSEPLGEKQTGYNTQQAMKYAKGVMDNYSKTPALGVNKKLATPKLTPKKAETIKTGGASERVKSNTPQKSMGQIGREMAKSGPRKNLRETAAAVKGKLQNAYRKATGSKSVSGEMDGKTFTGYERSNSRKSVVKVSNPTSGSSKMVDKFDRSGKLKSQKIVDRNASGKKVQVIKKKY